MEKSNIRAFLPVLILFIIVSLVALAFEQSLHKWMIDHRLIIIGNLVLFLVTFLSFYLYRRALIAGSTPHFLGNVYGGLFLKFFVCLAAVFIYIFSYRTAINKGGLFILMFLYLVYTFMEVSILLKLSKERKNG